MICRLSYNPTGYYCCDESHHVRYNWTMHCVLLNSESWWGRCCESAKWSLPKLQAIPRSEQHFALPRESPPLLHYECINSITSPSCTIYSFPSVRNLPASRALASEPASTKSLNDTTWARIYLSLKSV